MLWDFLADRARMLEIHFVVHPGKDTILYFVFSPDFGNLLLKMFVYNNTHPCVSKKYISLSYVHLRRKRYYSISSTHVATCVTETI